MPGGGIEFDEPIHIGEPEQIIEPDLVNPPLADPVDELRDRIVVNQEGGAINPGRIAPPAGHLPGRGQADEVAQKRFFHKTRTKRRRNNLQFRAKAAIFRRQPERLEKVLGKLEDEGLMTREEIRQFLFDTPKQKKPLREEAAKYKRRAGQLKEGRQMGEVIAVMDQYLAGVGDQPAPIRKMGTEELFAKIGGQAAIAKEVAGLAKRGDLENLEKLINEFGNAVINLPDQDGVLPFQHACNFAMDGSEKGLELVQLMIDNGADVNATNQEGRSVFLQVGLKGSPALLKALLNTNQIDVNQQSGIGLTVLHCAAMRGGEEGKEMAQMLLSRGAINLARNNGKTAADIARTKGHDEIVQMIESHVESTYTFDMARFGDQHEKLMADIGEGNIETVEKLVYQFGPGILNQKDAENLTPLERAVTTGQAEMVETLLELQANPNLVNPGEYSLLHFAVEQGHVDVVTTLIETGGMDPNAMTAGGHTPLRAAMQLEDLEKRADIMTVLIESGAICDDSLMAEFPDEAEVLEQIVQAHPPSQEAQQQFALRKAIVTGDQQAVSQLLEGNPSLANISHGTNPAATALANGNHQALRELMRHGASMELHGGRPSSTLLHQAIAREDTEAVGILIANMGNPSTYVNELGESPLHLAARAGLIDECRMLINAGFQDEADIFGVTPLSYIDDEEVIKDLQGALSANRAQVVREEWQAEEDDFFSIFAEDIEEEFESAPPPDKKVQEKLAEPEVKKKVAPEPIAKKEEPERKEEVKLEAKARDPEELEEEAAEKEEVKLEAKARDPEELEEGVQVEKKETTIEEKVGTEADQEVQEEITKKEAAAKETVKADTKRFGIGKQRQSQQKREEVISETGKFSMEPSTAKREEVTQTREQLKETEEAKEAPQPTTAKTSPEQRERDVSFLDADEETTEIPEEVTTTPAAPAKEGAPTTKAATPTAGKTSQSAKPKEAKSSEIPEEVVVAASAAAGKKEAEIGAPRKAVWPPPADWKPASEGEKVTAKSAKVEGKTAPEGEGGSAGGGPGGGMGGGAGGGRGEGGREQEEAGAIEEAELTSEFVEAYLKDMLLTDEDKEDFFLDNYKELINIENAVVMEKVFEILQPDELLTSPQGYDETFHSDLTDMVKEMVHNKQPGAIEILQDHGLSLVQLVGRDFLFEALKKADGMDIDTLLYGITPEEAGITPEKMSQLPSIAQEKIQEMTPKFNTLALADKAIGIIQKGEFDIAILKNRKKWRGDQDFKDAGSQFKREYRSENGLTKSQMEEVDKAIQEKTGKTMIGLVKENDNKIRDSLLKQVDKMKEQFKDLDDKVIAANRARVGYQQQGNQEMEQKKEAEWNELKQQLEALRAQFAEYKIEGYQE